jgi:hypothetical protein
VADIKTLKDEARGLEQQGRLTDALALYRQALDQLDSTTLIIRELPLFVKVGDLSAKAGDAEGAIASYETAAGHYADDGNTASVVALCVKILRVDVRRTAVFFRLARRMLERGHVEPARALLADFAERSMQQKLLEALQGAAGRPPAEIQAVVAQVLEAAERSFKAREERAAAQPAAPRAPAPAPPPTPSPPAAPARPAKAAGPSESLVIQFGAEYLTTTASEAPAERVVATPSTEMPPPLVSAVPVAPPAPAPPPPPLSPAASPPVPPTPPVPRASVIVPPPIEPVPERLVPELVPLAPGAEPPASVASPAPRATPSAAPPRRASGAGDAIAERPAERIVLTPAGPRAPRRPFPVAAVAVAAAVVALMGVGFFVLKGRPGAEAERGTAAAPAESSARGVEGESQPAPLVDQPPGTGAVLADQETRDTSAAVSMAVPGDTGARAEATPVAVGAQPGRERPAPPAFTITRPTVTISGLRVESVVDLPADSGPGYQVVQRLESGDPVYLTVAPRGGPADTLLAGQIVVGPVEDGAVGQTVFNDSFVTIHGPVAVVVVESLLRRLTLSLPPE